MHRTTAQTRTHVRLRRLGSRAIAAAVATLLISTGASTIGAPGASAAVAALLCDQSTVYGIDNSGALQAIDVASGTTRSIATMTRSTNALGVADGGRHAYAFSSGGGGVNVLDDYDADTNTVSGVPGVDSTAAGIRGAVNPANGLFYYAVNTTVSSSPTTTAIGAYDPATGTKVGRVGSIRVASSGSGGDMAFSKSGVLYFLTGNLIYRVDDAVPATRGAAVLGTTLIASIAGVSSSPGIAFAANGYLYASSGASLKKIDPANGTVAGTIPLPSGFNPNDLGGCNNPDSLAATVAVPDRVRSTDQWSVALAGGSTWSPASKTATTTGSAAGVQPEAAGPVLAVGGRTYTATQTMTSGSASDYTTTWSCAADGTVLASGTGTTATVVAPTGAATNGSDIDCRFTNTAKTATVAWTVAFPASRGAVGDQLDLAIHRGTASGSVEASTTTTGSGSAVAGGLAATTLVAARPVVLTGTMAAGSDLDLAQYGSTVTCTDGTGLQSGLPSGAPFTGTVAITPVAGAAIACVLTAAPRSAGVVASVVLGGARVADGDQFTLLLRDGSGAALPPGGTSKTTGSGSTIGAGSGTTGAAGVPAGSAVLITGSTSAHGGRYQRALTCTDAAGYTAGLPTAEAFSGSRTIVPAAGADLHCVLSVTPGVAALSVAITAPAAPTVGATAEYPVVVTNDGGSATATTTAQRLPKGVAYRGVRGAGWTCTASGAVVTGQLVTCDGPVVAADGGSAYTLQVVPTADVAGRRIVLPVRANPVGGAPGDPSACTASTPGCALAEAALVGTGVALAVTTTGPAALVRGVPAEYVLSITNAGTGPAAGATVLDRLPAGVRLVSASGASCTAAGALVTCAIPGPIGPDGAATVVLRVLPGDLGGTTGVNRVSVDGDGGTHPAAPAAGCSDRTCDTATAAVRSPALTLTLAVQGRADGLERGDVVRYAITVTNAGAVPLERITLSDGSSCATASLAAGATTTCTGEHAVAQADVEAGRVVRTATATGSVVGCTADCVAVSNEATASALTRTVSALRLAQTAQVRDANGNGRADVGERVTFTAVVTNTGTVAVTRLRVSGSLADLRCATRTLAPGASTTCTVTVVVRQGDIVAGGLTNTVMAQGRGAEQGTVATAHRTAALAAGALPVALASTGVDLVTPVGWAAGLLLLALIGAVVLRRRAVRTRRR